MSGDIVSLASWFADALIVEGVLDDNGLVSEVRRRSDGTLTNYSGTIKVGGQTFPLHGPMPIPVPPPNRFPPDDVIEVTFVGRPS